MLGQLLLQDVERKEEGSTLKQGVSRNRIVSVHDPEMRHGRKSSSKRFDGHKGALVVEQSEENTGLEVEKTIGDGLTREAFVLSQEGPS